MRKIVSVLMMFFFLSIVSGFAAAQNWQWSQLAPQASPSNRVGHDMAYDSESHRVILFGGETTPGSRIVNQETWGYEHDSDVNIWRTMDPGTRPSSRFAHAMAYDAESDRVVLFGGAPGSEETWAYDYNRNLWILMTPFPSPPGLAFADMAYDIESDRIILFGGFGGDFLGLNPGTWALDFDSNSWTRMNPAESPRARGIHAMAYDAESDRIILFGGRDDRQDFGDTWAYDHNRGRWRQMNPATSPSPRHGAAMAYDAASDRVVLFGGTTVAGGAPGGDETWVYDFNTDTWTLSEKGSGPSNRYGAVMTYDIGSARIVLFGGSSRGDETWSHRFVAPPPPFPWVYTAVGVAVGAVATVVTVLLVRRSRGKRGTEA